MKPRRHTITLPIARDDDEDMDVQVTFDVFQGERGHRDKWGAPETPDVDPSCEIVDVKPASINLTHDEQKQAEGQLWDELAEKMREQW